jgi:hypothetical protein
MKSNHLIEKAVLQKTLQDGSTRGYHNMEHYAQSEKHIPTYTYLYI